MTKNKLYDSLIIILFYIGFSCIPFSLFHISENLQIIFEIIAQLLIFFLLRLTLKKSPLKIKKKKIIPETAVLFIPTFIACFSNFFCLFDPYITIHPEFSVNLLLMIFLSFCIAFNEEYIFRMIIIDNLDKNEKPIVKVLISASVFAVCHLVHFFSTFNPIYLVVVAYTFGLGLILGLMYVYTNSCWFCVLFHFSFNVINNDFAGWINFKSNRNLSYYLINTGVAVVVGIYLLLIFLLKLNKKSEEEIEQPNE